MKNKLNNTAKIALSVTMVIALSGCLGGSNVKYGDAGAVETTDTNFGSTDLQQIATKMVDSLLSFPPIVQITSKRRPVMFVEKIKNKTTEHIDTESVTDTISSRVLRSGKFRFVDMEKVAAIEKQMEFQSSDNGTVSKASSMKRGQQIGAEYMMYGNLSSIVKRSGGTKDVYYKFTLKVMHVESGIIEWSDEKEIRKTKKRSTFGF